MRVPVIFYQMFLDPQQYLALSKFISSQGVDDCAIANSTSVCYGQDPAVMNFDQSLMRLHVSTRRLLRHF